MKVAAFKIVTILAILAMMILVLMIVILIGLIVVKRVDTATSLNMKVVRSVIAQMNVYQNNRTCVMRVVI